MAEQSHLSAQVISQITLMQHVVTQLPDRESIMRFVTRGMQDLPGVQRATYDLEEAAPEEDVAEAAHMCPIRSRHRCFAHLRLMLSDAEAYAPYIPYVQNLCSMLAIKFEEEHQRLENEALMDQLERRVRERTVELEMEVRERRRAEMQLRLNEESLRTTLNSIGDGVISTDVEGRVQRMNPVAEKLTGWPLAEAQGRQLTEVFDIISSRTRKPRQNLVAHVLKTGEKVELENHTILVSRDGTEYQIADSAAPIRSDEGRVTGVVLVFRDVSDEYALQEQLQQSRKMEAVGQLAGGIAHDFNNMLGGIMGAAELLEEYLPKQNPNAVRHHHLIIETTRRAGMMTDKLLAFARKKQPTWEKMDIHRQIDDVVELLRGTVDRRVNIRVSPDAENSQLNGDASQLQSVFMNLGINAAQAMPEGGELTITTKDRVLKPDEKQPDGSVLKPGTYLEVLFHDTGCGIPRDLLPRIFEPYFTTKKAGEGSGIGLSVVMGTVQLHQGAIFAESEPGKGSCFRILLPSEKADVERPAPARQDRARGGGCILVVDDEEIVRITVKAMLERLGYEVETAEDGQKALRLVEEMEEKPNLVIMDMIMPEMNGLDCCVALKQMDPTFRILLSSGYSHHDDMEKVEKLGVCGILHKPYSMTELSRRVSEALQQPASKTT